VNDAMTAFVVGEGRLLIVGEPWSGKTVAAYSIVETVDDQRLAGAPAVAALTEHPAPVLVNLSAWARPGFVRRVPSWLFDGPRSRLAVRGPEGCGTAGTETGVVVYVVSTTTSCSLDCKGGGTVAGWSTEAVRWHGDGRAPPG